MDPRSRSGWLVGGLGVLLVVAVGLLIRVSLGKRAAEASWNELYDLAMHPHAGMYVPAYEGVTAGGDTVRVGEAAPGGRQVLLFFTTSCPYCRASIPGWKRLWELARERAEVELVGLALDSLHLARDYEREHGLPYPVVEMNSPRFARLFRVSGVPLTMVVEAGGRVSYARRGEFSDPALFDSVRTVLDRPPLDESEAPVRVPSIGEADGSG